jgi:hypothetical protein
MMSADNLRLPMQPSEPVYICFHLTILNRTKYDTFICPTQVKQLSDPGRIRIRPRSDSCLTRVGQILLLGGADSTRLYLTGSSEKLSARKGG